MVLRDKRVTLRDVGFTGAGTMWSLEHEHLIVSGSPIMTERNQAAE